MVGNMDVKKVNPKQGRFFPVSATAIGAKLEELGQILPVATSNVNRVFAYGQLIFELIPFTKIFRAK